jgi:Fur family transcriptional regulator, ferric uptake regulator
MISLQNILDDLRKNGHRITVARKDIIRLLLDSPEPLSADNIYQLLTHTNRSVNKTTIYREIDFLCNYGAAIVVYFRDGKKRYEISNEHHHHTVCVFCNKIADVRTHLDLSSEEKQISKDTGFSITAHNLEFFGMCSSCKKLQPKTSIS